jgi:hypothetical protein
LKAGDIPLDLPEDGVGVADLPCWMPFRLVWGHGRGWLDWCCPGDLLFTDPFFDQTVQKALQGSAGRVCLRRTSVDVLRKLNASEPGPMLKGFIFHMSRSGSTLVTQMLAAMPHSAVISEASIIDAIIHAHLRIPASDNQRACWLRGVIAVLGRAVAGDRCHLFIKFDAWHVLQLPLIQQTFPDVPWIFIYRHPIEVVASHARQGRDLLNSEGATRTARILACFCRSALQNLNGTGRLVEYQQLPASVWTDVLGHFDVNCSAADIDRMRAVAQFDAKNPSVRFHDDSRAKRNELPERARAAVVHWVMPLYEELEQRRISLVCSSNDRAKQDRL